MCRIKWIKIRNQQFVEISMNYKFYLTKPGEMLVHVMFMVRFLCETTGSF